MYFQRFRAGCAAGMLVCTVLLAALPGSRVYAFSPPAEPATENVTARELWRAGGEDDESIIFGVLTAVDIDASGNVYLLDSQLHEVMVFSPDGEYLRSIGREGEGPGEFRRPSSMFITAGGQIAVVQSAPGRIILLTPTGDPAGNYPLPEAPEGGTQFFTAVQRAGDGVAIDLRRMARKDTGMDVTRALMLVDDKGAEQATFYTNTAERNFAKLTFDEKQMRALVWAAAADGHVYTSDEHDAYTIKVWNPDGTLAHTIKHPYEHRKRSKAEVKRNTPNVMIRGRDGHSPDVETSASPTDRDIIDMYPRDDGSVWVISSHGAFDNGKGVLATFDVFDAGGQFTRRVAVEAVGSYYDDRITFAGDRLFVLRGQRSARAAMFGGVDEEGEPEEAEPMSVVCYDLARILQGRN